MKTDLIEKYAPTLCGSMPPVIRDPRLLMDASGDLKIYYAPFEYINPSARIVLVGKKWSRHFRQRRKWISGVLGA
jgi:hypothetical protein